MWSVMFLLLDVSKKNRVGTAIAILKLSDLIVYIVKAEITVVCCCRLEPCLLCFTCQLVVRAWKYLSLKICWLLSNVFTINSTQLQIKNIFLFIFRNALKILRNLKQICFYSWSSVPLIHSFVLNFLGRNNLSLPFLNELYISFIYFILKRGYYFTHLPFCYQIVSLSLYFASFHIVSWNFWYSSW